MPESTCQERLRSLRAARSPDQRAWTRTVTTCGGTGCQASRSMDVVEALRAELTARGLDETVRVRVTGCHGFCEQGPILIIDPANVFYCHVAVDDVAEIVAHTITEGNVIERLLYTDPVSGKRVVTEAEIPFYRHQDRVLLAQNRQVDPEDIGDYLAIGGYGALTKVLDGMTPEAVIEEISASGRRGRGGGGYPTGRKWAQCRAAKGDPKYVVCNADEGDPGAYMDRSIL